MLQTNGSRLRGAFQGLGNNSGRAWIQLKRQECRNQRFDTAVFLFSSCILNSVTLARLFSMGLGCASYAAPSLSKYTYLTSHRQISHALTRTKDTVAPCNMTAIVVSSSPSLISLGGIGAIYKLNACIVVKIPRYKDDPDHATEQSIFDILESHPPHPNLVTSFLRVPNATFLEFLPGGDLASRLWAQQRRDPKTQQVLAVSNQQLPKLRLRWMKELSAAAAWLEEIGLAHGDIRPSNVLFDSDDHVKLSDFDRSIKVGEHLDSGTEPFARLLDEEGGQDRGTYGKAGPRTEQFALGSVIYSLVRGYDPYEDKWFGKDHGPILIDKFQKMKFPPLSGSTLDIVIQKCWYGQFATIKQLYEAMDSHGGWCEETKVKSTELIMERRANCEEIIKNEVLKTFKM